MTQWTHLEEGQVLAYSKKVTGKERELIWSEIPRTAHFGSMTFSAGPDFTALLGTAIERAKNPRFVLIMG